MALSRGRRVRRLASDAVRNGTDPLLLDLAAREICAEPPLCCWVFTLEHTGVCCCDLLREWGSKLSLRKARASYLTKR
jgi:hypothetical protein